MELKDTREIAAPRAEVWNALLSAEVLKECVPGCQEMTGSASEGFEATVVQKVGPVKATFKGAVTLSDIVEGQSLTLSGEGKGGAAGFAKGGAQVTLADNGAGTTLTYDVTAKVGGKLAQLGCRSGIAAVRTAMTPGPDVFRPLVNHLWRFPWTGRGGLC